MEVVEKMENCARPSSHAIWHHGSFSTTHNLLIESIHLIKQTLAINTESGHIKLSSRRKSLEINKLSFLFWLGFVSGRYTETCRYDIGSSTGLWNGSATQVGLHRNQVRLFFQSNIVSLTD